MIAEGRAAKRVRRAGSRRSGSQAAELATPGRRPDERATRSRASRPKRSAPRARWRRWTAHFKLGPRTAGARGGAGPRQPAAGARPRRRGAGRLREAAGRASSTRRLRFLAHEGLGYAYEKKGKLAEAQATFAKLGGDAASLGGFYKDRARYHEARLAELQGNPGEAARIYHEVLDKNPTTSLRDEISNRLALLELK